MKTLEKKRGKKQRRKEEKRGVMKSQDRIHFLYQQENSKKSMCINNVLEPLFSSYRLCSVIEIELNN